jgi:riboflavin-specific deaminase-like protein
MFIFSNLAISLDGKIATQSRAHFPLGTSADREQMHVLRAQSDAILMGASSLRAFKKPLLVPAAEQRTNIIVSTTLKNISPAWKFFTDRSIPRLLFVGPSVSRTHLKKFEKSSELFILKKPTSKLSTATQVVRELEKRGIKNLLVEGGGSLMWDFVSENLIDEYHVTVTPRLLGGTESPTLVDGPGFEPSQVLNLKLSQCRVVGDELYLIYRKTKKRG